MRTHGGGQASRRAETGSVARALIADAKAKRARRCERRVSEGRVQADAIRWAAVQRRYQAERAARRG